MRFGFDEDQLLLQQALRDFLAREYRPERIRRLWEKERAHDPELWSQLASLGVTGLLVPERHEGLGLDEIAAVLLHEEAGRAALAEPLIETAAVAAPLLEATGGAWADRWLPAIARGEAVVAVGHTVSPFVRHADVARLLLLIRDEGLYAVLPARASCLAQPANDPSQRLFEVAFTPADATELARGGACRELLTAALDRGALAAAAQQLGVAERLLEMASDYARQREQFGRPIGSFQAVKHMLADVKVELEYARPVVYRAAHSVARGVPGRACHVSMAKLAACWAAARAARVALQVHGAIGYTWEQDLHIWMRRAWSLALAWGSEAFHRARVADAILEPGAGLGPGTTFAQGD